MFTISRVLFNINAVGIKDNYKITQAKKDYVSIYNECAICGCVKGLEVHHVVPVHINLDLSCNPNNFITLCDGLFGANSGCHNRLGHWGNFRTKSNPNIRQLAVYSRLQMQKYDPDRKFIIETPLMIEMYSRAMNMSKDEFLKSIIFSNTN